MSLSVGELVAYLEVDDTGFERGLSQAEGSMGRWGARLATAAAVTGAAVAAAVGSAVVSGVRRFAELESGMNEVFTLLPGISEQAMGRMTQQVRDFSVEMGTATTDVVPALYQALSAGVPEDNVFEFLETANKAAVGGITDLETSVDGITSVVNAYGDQISGAAEASDLMFTAVRLGKTDFGQLSTSLSNVIPIAAANKVQFDDIAAALATMTAQGVPTAEATTQLRQSIVELSDAGSQAGEAFEKVAGESFRDFIASGGDMGDVMAILQEAAEDSGVSVDQLFGSVEAGSAILALSGDNLEGFRANLGEMGDAAGATDEAFQTMDQGLSRSWDRIRTVFEDLLLELGERVAPHLQRFADWFEENLPGIIEWFERMGEKAEEFGRRLQDWWNDQAKPAIDEFVEAIRENWPKVEEIFESLGRVVESIGRIFGAEFDNMTGDSEEGTGSITDDVTTVIDSLNLLATTIANVSEWVANAWNVLSGAVKMDAGQMATGIDDLTNGALSRFEEGVDETLANVGRWFAELPGRIMDAISGLGEDLADAGSRVVGDFIEGMESRIGDVGSAASKVVSKVRNFLPFSPAKEGPLSGSGAPNLAGQRIVQMLADGMDSQLSTLAAAADRAASSALARMDLPAFDRRDLPARGDTDQSTGSRGGDVVQQFYGPVTDSVTGRAAALALRMA